jgi:alpha-tubulin suppressor-like RCC1 family protein
MARHILAVAAFAFVISCHPAGDSNDARIGEPEFIDVRAAGGHTIALAKDGRVYSWGAGPSGELGRQNYDYKGSVSYPKIVEIDDNVLSIEAGFDQSFAIGRSYSYAWGSNDFGKLGIGYSRENDVQSPAKMRVDTRIKEISIGTPNVIALSNKGKIYTWGGVEYTRKDSQGLAERRLLASPKPLSSVSSASTAVSAGGGFGLSLTPEGVIWTWGESPGSKNSTQNRSVVSPTRLGVSDEETKKIRVVQIEAGIDFGLALTGDGEVYGWGENDEMQLGCTTSDAQARLTRIEIPPAAYITAGSFSGYALTRDGELYSWGRSMYGNLGYRGDGAEDKDYACPAKVQGVPSFRKIDAGYYTAAALDSTGQVWTWGGNELLQLGRPDSLGTYTATPGPIVLDPSAYPEEWPEDDGY